MIQSVQFVLLLVKIVTHGANAQSFNLKIKENTPENAHLYDLNLFDQQGSEPLKNKKFTIISVDSNVKSLFLLKTDGNLYTSKLIDLELLCDQIDKCCPSAVRDLCEIAIDVAVSSESMTSPRTFKVTIQIEDENDNVPKFPESKITISIKESDKVESRFKLPLATDIDRSKFSINAYKLVEEPLFPPTFAVEYLRQVKQLNLKLIQKLDREKKSAYRLTILAIDGGNPPKTGKMEIDIKVLDVNDNPPRLIRTYYKEKQKESVFSTQPLITIEAKDDDENGNAELYFQIINENNDDRKYFRIENGTGKIFLNQALDYEKQEEHRFFVEVSNKDSDIERSTATVLINVENVNDEQPEISINYLNTDRNHADIKENDMQAKFVALATVIDKDKGIGGQVFCKLLNYIETFEIQVKDPPGSPSQYSIKTKVSLDREKKAYYEVIMECQDRGFPSKKTKKDVKIKVIDVNDNPPVIKTLKDLNVKENSPKGHIVTTIQAMDEDEGENSRLSFSISDSEDPTLQFLDIDSSSGELRIKEVIDRERDSELLKYLPVTLRVSDGGTPPLTSTTSFKVKIEDVNDNSPIFKSDLIQFSVTENQPPFYTLGDILVSDKDDDAQLKVTLAPSSNQHSNPFQLFSKENKFFLNTTRSLDWEKEKSFSMKVIASDGYGLQSHTATAEIVVNVTDENDNTPVIIFPSQKNFTVQKLSFHEKSGFSVLTISAIDKDSPDTNNGKVSYHIQDHKDLLIIDPTNGVIKTSRSMTRSDIGKFDVKVVARDNGTPQRESSITLFIEVDESKPHLNIENYRDNDENLIISSSNNLWTKEGFLVISLIVLLLFLLLCVFIVLYMRHIRGMFPTLPDIFPNSKNESKGRKGSKGSGYTGSHIPLDPSMNVQQTIRIHEKGSQPFYLNQFESPETNANCSTDHHQSVNSYRQYETMKYHHYSPGNFVTSEMENGPPFNYDQLFYTSPNKHCDGSILRLHSNSTNNSNLYDNRPSAKPSSTSHNLSICHRIRNNIESNPLLPGNISKDSYNERFPSDPGLKTDDRERKLVDNPAINTPDPRGHIGAFEKIDTYALSYPVEQSTFV